MMSEPNGERSHPAAPGEARAKSRRRLAPWKRHLLAASCVMMAAGLARQGAAFLTRPSSPPERPGPASGAPGVTGLVSRGFVPDAAPQAESQPAEAERAIDTWSPVMFRWGFSFFVGFCIAYALRTFFKVSAVAIGLVLLALFGLSYAGVVHVDWTAMQRHYDSVTRYLAGQWSSLRQFVTGSLPASAMAALGLVVGFKKG